MQGVDLDRDSVAQLHILIPQAHLVVADQDVLLESPLGVNEIHIVKRLLQASVLIEIVILFSRLNFQIESSNIGCALGNQYAHLLCLGVSIPVKCYLLHHSLRFIFL